MHGTSSPTTRSFPVSKAESVVFDGISQFTFEGNLIACYREQFNTGMAMAQLDFAPERIAKHLKRRAAALRKSIS